MSKFETSLKEGAHANLAAMTGNWKGTTKTWFEPNKLADESPMEGNLKTILGGRFLLHEYHGSLEGKAFEGIAIIGYYHLTNSWQQAWVDSFHMGTGILMSESEPQANATDGKVNVLGSYGWEGGDEKWGWRTTLEMQGNDTLIITAFNIIPGQEEAKATETIYQRV